MSENPNEMPRIGSAVESASSTTVDVLDATTREQVSIGGKSAVITLDLVTGTRVFTERDVRVRSNDGRLIDVQEQVYRCLCGCNTPLLTRHSVLFCAFCQSPIALTHAKSWDDGITRERVCPACWEPGHRRRAVARVLRWLQQV